MARNHNNIWYIFLLKMAGFHISLLTCTSYEQKVHWQHDGYPHPSTFSLTPLHPFHESLREEEPRNRVTEESHGPSSTSRAQKDHSIPTINPNLPTRTLPLLSRSLLSPPLDKLLHARRIEAGLHLPWLRVISLLPTNPYWCFHASIVICF